MKRLYKAQERRLPLAGRAHPVLRVVHGPEDTPWLDAHGLRMQIDEVLPVVIQRAGTAPDHQFSGRVQGKLLAILAAIRNQYSSKVDPRQRRSWICSWCRTPKHCRPWTRSRPLSRSPRREIRIVLASVRASLLSAGGAGEQHTSALWLCRHHRREAALAVLTRNIPTLPLGKARNWQEGPGDRQYRTFAGRQHRRAAAHRSQRAAVVTSVQQIFGGARA